MSDPVYIVQFPHPGGEHRPRGSVMPWNLGPHARKFMLTEGTYGDDDSTEGHGSIVFWGEWEGPSRVLRRWAKEGPLPRVLHEPFFDTPPSGDRQNTDPWVFGETFYYSNCKQRTNRGRTATAMQRLTPGSLILFGSSIAGEFVLDTVFVIGERLGSFVPGQRFDLDVDSTFRVATIESLAPWAEDKEDPSFSLYAGARRSRSSRGMFSFVPCLPHDGDGPRFARPTIQLPGIVNASSKQSAAGAKRPQGQSEVRKAWTSVVEQVLDQDLLLATQLDLPDQSPSSIQKDKN